MKTIAIVGIIASILALATAATTVTLSNMVYAKDTQNGNNPNLFGQDAANDFAKKGEMGDHASDPNDDGTPGNDNQHTGENNHRLGIGNVGPTLDNTCGSKHPADLAAALTGKSDSCNP